jgi:hypothetical protein
VLSGRVRLQDALCAHASMTLPETGYKKALASSSWVGHEVQRAVPFGRLPGRVGIAVEPPRLELAYPIEIALQYGPVLIEFESQRFAYRAQLVSRMQPLNDLLEADGDL